MAVIDPDKTYRRAMASCLRLKGFEVLELPQADAYCIEALTEAGAEAALISAEAFQGDGSSLLASLRALRPGLQLAIVSAQPDQNVEEALLAAGAADVFDRRRSSAIVTKRLSLLVEGARGVAEETEEGEETLDCGPLRLRLQSHRALWQGEEVPLTVTEFRILRLLVRSGEPGASYREIYDMVHGAGFEAGDGPDGYRTNVRSLIRRIRAKFAAQSESFDAIENLPGRGYRWRSGQADLPRHKENSALRPLDREDHRGLGAAG
ncbi:MAG: winged helix-turn-helix domain-containing protein [Rhodovibrionaceae bacterium]